MDRRAVRLGAVIAVAVAAGACLGCRLAGQLAQSYLRKPTRGGMQTQLRRSIEEGIDRAVQAVERAWTRQLAARREADAVLAERQSLAAEETRAFYAERCAGVADAQGGGSAAAAERQAEAAFAAGDAARAAALLEGRYRDAVERAGPEDPEVARVANRLAIAQLAAGDPRAAIGPALRGLAARRAILADAPQDGPRRGRAALDVAESQTTVALVYRAAGAYDAAREQLQGALEVRTRALGAEHLCVAQARTQLGELEALTGAFWPALAHLRQALATRERQLPPGHRDLAQSYADVGAVYQAVALFAPARAHAERALAVRLQLGAAAPEVADSYHQLASLSRVQGDFVRAEELYQQALALRRARAAEGLEVAETEAALAELALGHGDSEKAERLQAHAHALRRARLPAGHPELARSLVELARVRAARLDFARAEQDLRAAAATWERRFGRDHPLVAHAAAALGELLLVEGKLDEAEPPLVRARALRERALGPDHPDTAESLHLLGVLAYARCQYARAEPLLRAAIDVRARRLGELHPDLGASVTYLAALLVATGRVDEALGAFRRAQGISEAFVTSFEAVASEARLEAVLRFVRAQEDVVYSLLDDPALAGRAAPLALSVALLRKGRSIEQAAALSRAAHVTLGESERRDFDELRALRAQLARARLAPREEGPGGDGAALAERAERLEEALAQRSAEGGRRAASPGLDQVLPAVAAALPPDAALVEVLRHRVYRFEAAPGQPRWQAPRYSALVLRPGGAVAAVDLGEAEPIDTRVRQLLAAVTADEEGAGPEPGGALQEASRALERLVIEPLLPHLARDVRLVFSPDGELHLLPLWALHDGRQYLVDRFELTYVTSGRDLLRPEAERRGHAVAVFASPEFLPGAVVAGAAYRGATRGLEVVEDVEAGLPVDRLAPGALRLRSPPSPLPGTEQEARAIQRLLPSARIVLGPEATKARFLELRAPAIVHVATHALFRREAGALAGSRGLAPPGALLPPLSAAAIRTQPLLDAMLLWANVTGTLSTDQGRAVVLEPAGLATALEVAGMDLWGTQLVVLSACDTGRGQVGELGQGVYGLRRAVMVAGAETLVTSLWKVDDAVTRDLMAAYYARLLEGAGRGEALRQASLAVRRRHPSPRYWAPFIAVGRAGPVTGLR